MKKFYFEEIRSWANVRRRGDERDPLIYKHSFLAVKDRARPFIRRRCIAAIIDGWYVFE
jgi:hypothetical protein